MKRFASPAAPCLRAAAAAARQCRRASTSRSPDCSPGGSRFDQTLRLPDGRDLGFAELGAAAGYPLLFFHGFPASRVEARGLDALARRRNLRVVAPDRPGYGLSTFQPGRRITDWPADVKALTSHLGLRRFAVLGGSGGGPYALACAHALPPDMLSAVGMMASAPPWKGGTGDVLRSAKLIHWAATAWPGGVVALTDLLVRVARGALGTGPGLRMLERRVLPHDGSKPRDGQAAREETRQLLEVAFSGFVQGADACVQEALLLTNDWGFDFEDVGYDKVQVWHGTRDVNAPVSMIRYMAEHLPHCDLREYDDSHFTLGRHLEDILSQLIPEETMRSFERNAKA